MNKEPDYSSEGSLDPFDALKLVLLFYTIQWNDEKKAEWLRITGSTEASTKVMCDHIRMVMHNEKPNLKVTIDG